MWFYNPLASIRIIYYYLEKISSFLYLPSLIGPLDYKEYKNLN